jgi:hypothetical protein
MITEGQRLYYGTVIKIVSSAKNPREYWVLIKNHSHKAPRNSFSLYILKDLNKGELHLTHFYPKELIEALQSLDEKEMSFDLPDVDFADYKQLNKDEKPKRKKK